MIILCSSSVFQLIVVLLTAGGQGLSKSILQEKRQKIRAYGAARGTKRLYLDSELAVIVPPFWKCNAQSLIRFCRRVCLRSYTSSLSNSTGKCWLYISWLCPNSLRRYYLVHCTVHHCIWASKSWVWKFTRSVAPSKKPHRKSSVWGSALCKETHDATCHVLQMW